MAGFMIRSMRLHSFGAASVLRFFIGYVFAFLIIYNITFRLNDVVTTGRISVVLLLIWYIFSIGKVPLVLNWEKYVIFIPLPYVIVQLVFVQDLGQVSRFLNLAFYSYLGGVLIARFIGSLETLLWVFLICIFSQSLILIFTFGGLSFRSWIDANVVVGANYDAFNLYRAIGLTSSAGSALSVIQSLGVLCGGWLLLVKSKRNDLLSVVYLLILMIFCLLSSALVGRTGLYLSFLFFFLSLYFSDNLRYLFYLIPIFGMLALYADISDVYKLASSEISAEWLMNWMLGVFSSDDGTIRSLSSMPLPQLNSIDTWFGHGRSSLVDGLNPSGHDSGFIQVIYSMGLIFGVFFYFAYFYVLMYLLKWLPATFGFWITILLFLIEFKEPFVFKYIILFVLVAVDVLARRDKQVFGLTGARG